MNPLYYWTFTQEPLSKSNKSLWHWCDVNCLVIVCAISKSLDIVHIVHSAHLCTSNCMLNIDGNTDQGKQGALLSCASFNIEDSGTVMTLLSLDRQKRAPFKSPVSSGNDQTLFCSVHCDGEFTLMQMKGQRKISPSISHTGIYSTPLKESSQVNWSNPLRHLKFLMSPLSKDSMLLVPCPCYPSPLK